MTRWTSVLDTGESAVLSWCESGHRLASSRSRLLGRTRREIAVEGRHPDRGRGGAQGEEKGRRTER